MTRGLAGSESHTMSHNCIAPNDIHSPSVCCNTTSSLTSRRIVARNSNSQAVLACIKTRPRSRKWVAGVRLPRWASMHKQLCFGTVDTKEGPALYKGIDQFVKKNSQEYAAVEFSTEDAHPSLSTESLSAKPKSQLVSHDYSCLSGRYGWLRDMPGFPGEHESPRHSMKRSPDYDIVVVEATSMHIVGMIPGLCLAPRLDLSTSTHIDTDMRHCRSPILQQRCQPLHVSKVLTIESFQDIPFAARSLRMLAVPQTRLFWVPVTKPEEFPKGNNGKRSGVLQLPETNCLSSKLHSTLSPPRQPRSSRTTSTYGSSTGAGTKDTTGSECTRAPAIEFTTGELLPQEFTAESADGFRDGREPKCNKDQALYDEDELEERVNESVSRDSLLSLVRAQVEDAVDSRLLPLISVLKKQAESERKYREKLLILKQQKLNLKHDKYQSKRQRIYVSSKPTQGPNYFDLKWEMTN